LFTGGETSEDVEVEKKIKKCCMNIMNFEKLTTAWFPPAGPSQTVPFEVAHLFRLYIL
jgi:hypothetical protein